MFEAYAIGVTLRLHNLISPQLVIVAEDLLKVEKIADSVSYAMRKLGESKALKKIATGSNATTKALDKTAASAANLERHLAALHAAGNVPLGAQVFPTPQAFGGGGRQPPALPGAGGGGGNTGGRRHGPNGPFHGGNIHMGSGGIGLGTVGVAAGDAFLPLAVSGAMLWGGHALYESAKSLNTEMQRFKLYGLGDKLNAEAFQFVREMQIYGTTTAENMKIFREAQGVFRESGLNDSAALDGAKLAAPVIAKINFATEAFDEESKAKMRTSAMSMMRWVEMSGGLKDAATFNRLAEIGWKLTQSSGGNVDWEQLRQFSATSGVAGQFITAEGLAALEPVIGELKGGRAGTGLRTAYNRLEGVVKLPNQVAHLLADNGIWDASKISWNDQGGIKRFNGNPFPYSHEFQTNPAKFYEERMLPMYQKKGFDDQERARYNQLIFGSTGGAEFTIIDKQMEAIHRSMEAVNKFFDIGKSVEIGREGLSGAEIEFKAAWTEFKTVFGEQFLPTFSGLLRFGAGIFRTSPSEASAPKFGDLSIAQRIHEVAAGVISLIPGFGPATAGGGRGSINPVAPQRGAVANVTVTNKLDRKGFSTMVAGDLAKGQQGAIGSGTFDPGVAQLPMNVRMN